MDRTAWIVVALCVIGLVAWQIYVAKQMPPRPAPVNVASGQASPTATPEVFKASTPRATPETTPKTAEPVPSFAEKIETLRNSDVELRLTNRGGGIKEAILLRQIAENGQRVVLNSDQSAANWRDQRAAIQPQRFPSSLYRRVGNSLCNLRAEQPEQVAIRKKFYFQKSRRRKTTT